jgi:hypothetical protein
MGASEKNIQVDIRAGACRSAAVEPPEQQPFIFELAEISSQLLGRSRGAFFSRVILHPLQINLVSEGVSRIRLSLRLPAAAVNEDVSHDFKGDIRPGLIVVTHTG